MYLFFAHVALSQSRDRDTIKTQVIQAQFANLSTGPRGQKARRRPKCVKFFCKLLGWSAQAAGRHTQAKRPLEMFWNTVQGASRPMRGPTVHLRQTATFVR